jgi:hypothetical protein
MVFAPTASAQSSNSLSVNTTSTYRIKNVYSGKYLTYHKTDGYFRLENYTADNYIGDQSNQINQLWEFTQNPNGSYRIVVSTNSIGKENYEICHGSSYLNLEAPNYPYSTYWDIQTLSSGNVVIEDFRDDGYQMMYGDYEVYFGSYYSGYGNKNEWQLELVTTGVPSGFRIKNVYSGKYLTYHKTDGYFRLEDYTANDYIGTPSTQINQVWEIVQNPNGSYRIIVANNNIGKENYEICHGSSYLNLEAPNYPYSTYWDIQTLSSGNVVIEDFRDDGYQMMYGDYEVYFGSYYPQYYGNKNEWQLELAS